ncbi:MAG: ATP-grasp domain-containing protein [Candidatus Poseidoniales archaeon]
MKVAVLNCFSRNGLATINSISNDIELFGGYSSRNKSRTFLSYFFKSKKVKDIFPYTSPEADSEQFKEDIISAIKKFKLAGIIPAGTIPSNFLSIHKKEIIKRTNAKIFIEDYATFRILNDKWSTYKLCKSYDIPVPKTILLSDVLYSSALLSKFSFPVVIKPRSLYGSQGFKIIASKIHLLNFFKNRKDILFEVFTKNSYIMQEYVEGNIHDVNLFSWRGEIKSVLSQERLVTMNDFGGGGVINRTTNEKDIMQLSEKIVKKTGWSGIANFEYLKNPNGKCYLLECNPKIWGTTQLTIESGLNVIDQYVNCLLKEKEIDRVEYYKINMVYRWIFPWCVSSWFTSPLSIRHILTRISKTFKRYDSETDIHNLKVDELRHLFGIVINKLNIL